MTFSTAVATSMIRRTDSLADSSDQTDYGIAAVGDYDNDGHPDIYVCRYGHYKLFHNRGDGTFEDVTAKAGVGVEGFSTGAVWFDYDKAVPANQILTVKESP